MNVNNIIPTKSFYRFIEFVSKLVGRGLTHEKYKQLALDICKAESKEELDVKHLSDSYNYILNNIKQDFSETIINNSYFLLSGKVIENDNKLKILKNYYTNINDRIQHRVMYIIREILKTNIDRKIEYLFIISNYMMLKENRNPLIPYNFIYDEFKTNIKLDDKEKWIFLIAQMEESRKEDFYSINKSLDEIIDLLKDNLSTIKNKYKVEFLALYGSVVKGITTSSTDIDFLVSFDDSLIDYERGSCQEELQKYLEEILGGKVDLIDFTHALTNLDICEMKNSIILIKREGEAK